MLQKGQHLQIFYQDWINIQVCQMTTDLDFLILYAVASPGVTRTHCVGLILIPKFRFQYLN